MATAAVDVEVLDVLVERWHADPAFRSSFCANPVSTLARVGIVLDQEEWEELLVLGLPYLSSEDLEQLFTSGLPLDGRIVEPDAHC